MFEIKFRVLDDVDELAQWDSEKLDTDGDLEGLILLSFNGNEYGLYHEKGSFQEGVEGFYLMTHWFQSLAEVCVELQQSDYVALSDIESFNSWIEFKIVNKNHLNISLIETEPENGTGYIVTQPFTSYSYSGWKDILISQGDFRQEVFNKSNDYLSCVKEINPNFIHSNRIVKLVQVLDQVQILS